MIDDIIYSINDDNNTCIYQLHAFLNIILQNAEHNWSIIIINSEYMGYRIDLNYKKKTIKYYKPTIINIYNEPLPIFYKKYKQSIPNNYYVKHVTFNENKKIMECYLHDYASRISIDTYCKLEEIL